MKKSEKGSYSIHQIKDLLHISKVTAYEISKLPELNRRMIAGTYRVSKTDFWKWYNSQDRYTAYEESIDPDDFFTTKDIAEMFGWRVNSSIGFLTRTGLRTDISSTRVLTAKEVFIDWYIHQFRYSSNDPRLPPKEVMPVYDIHQVKNILEIRSNRTVYNIYARGFFNIIRVENLVLVEKESFDKWFSEQDKYPLKEK